MRRITLRGFLPSGNQFDQGTWSYSYIKIGARASSNFLLARALGGEGMHAVIENTDEGVRLISVAGYHAKTRVNGRTVEHMQYVTLSSGDVLEFGEHRVELSIESEGGTVRVAQVTPEKGWWTHLGLRDKPDSLAKVRSAYRRRIMKVHPDRGGTSEAMRQVRKAFEEGAAYFRAAE